MSIGAFSWSSLAANFRLSDFNAGGGVTINNTFVLNQINNLPLDLLSGMQKPQCGCEMPKPAWIPPPSMPLSGAPAGKGLADVSGQTSGDGQNAWPPNTTQDAAGAHFVVKGGTEVDVFSPGQNPTEAPYQRISGDPHSNFEQAGRTTDYTGKMDATGHSGQDFQYPWGTRMYTETTSDKGRSLVDGVTLWSGSDRQTWTGVTGTPQTDGIHADGFETRAEHIATQGDRPTWDLGGSEKNVEIMQESHGRVDGLVTGTHYDGEKYVADLDQNRPLCAQEAEFRRDTALGDLRPSPFMNPGGYGEMLRGFADDRSANFLSRFGDIGEMLSQSFAYGIKAGDRQAMYRQYLEDMEQGGWGGLGALFPNWGSVGGRLSGLARLLLNGGQLFDDYSMTRLQSLI
jgi:hypothetical protein